MGPKSAPKTVKCEASKEQKGGKKSSASKPASPKPGKKVEDHGDANGANKSKSKSKSKRSGLKTNHAIRMLMEADRKYKKCVHDARKRRKELLVQARFEATGELNQFKKDLEAVYLAKLEKFAVEDKAVSEKIRSETDRSLKEITEKFLSHKFETLKLLEEAVVNIDPRPHKNLTLRREIEADDD